MILRITSGTAKNKKLKAPSSKDFRAVQEIAKLSLFSIFEDRVEHAVCLDLFAGSGNLGLEALSRGADWCDFVDNDYNAYSVIAENIGNCGFSEKAKVHRQSSVKFVKNVEKSYNIIFVDPYYEETSHIFLMKNLGEKLKENGVVAFFHGKNLKMEDLIKDSNLEIVTERKFGSSYFSILHKRRVEKEK